MDEKIEVTDTTVPASKEATDRIRTPPSHAEKGGHAMLAKDPEALAREYGASGLKGLMQSGFVVRCALFAAMGGFL